MTAALIPEAAGLAETAAARGAAAGGAASAAKNAKTGSKSARHAKKTVSGHTRETQTSRGRESDTGSHVSETVRTHKRGRSAGTRRSKVGTGTSGAKRFSTGTLIAEWVLGLVLIAVTVPLEKSENGYATTISTMMLRLSGLSGIFFALALVSESEHARKFAIYFGFLIDLGIIYHATTSGGTKKIATIFSGKSAGSGGVVLASDFTDKGDAPQPTPFGDASTHVFSSSGSNSPAPSGSPGGAQLNPNYPGGSQTIPTPPVGGV